MKKQYVLLLALPLIGAGCLGGNGISGTEGTANEPESAQEALKEVNFPDPPNALTVENQTQYVDPDGRYTLHYPDELVFSNSNTDNVMFFVTMDPDIADPPDFFIRRANGSIKGYINSLDDYIQKPTKIKQEVLEGASAGIVALTVYTEGPSGCPEGCVAYLVEDDDSLIVLAPWENFYIPYLEDVAKSFKLTN